MIFRIFCLKTVFVQQFFVRMHLMVVCYWNHQIVATRQNCIDYETFFKLFLQYIGIVIVSTLSIAIAQKLGLPRLFTINDSIIEDIYIILIYNSIYLSFVYLLILTVNYNVNKKAIQYFAYFIPYILFTIFYIIFDFFTWNTLFE